MEGSFAKWNVLQAAHPCFRTGTLQWCDRIRTDQGARCLWMVAL